MATHQEEVYVFKHDKRDDPSNYYRFTFRDQQLYNLFKEYGTQSKTILEPNDPEGSKIKIGSTGFEVVRCQTDDSQQTISVPVAAWGDANFIGKFFLETGLDLPEEYTQGIVGYEPAYKQPTDGVNPSLYAKGTTTLKLGRYGTLEIPPEIINKLQAYQRCPDSELLSLPDSKPLSTGQKIGYGLLFFGVSASSVTALTASCLDVEQNQKLFSLLPDGAFKDHVITALMATGPHGHNYTTGISIAVLVLLALVALTVAYPEKWQTVKDTAKDYVCPGKSSASSQ